MHGEINSLLGEILYTLKIQVLLSCTSLISSSTRSKAQKILTVLYSTTAINLPEVSLLTLTYIPLFSHFCQHYSIFMLRRMFITNTSVEVEVCDV